MKYRCLNPKARRYEYYGGKGITIDPTWFDFKTFVSDMGERPSKDYSLDRIDSEKGYNKLNCKWILKKENSKKAYKKMMNTTFYISDTVLLLAAIQVVFEVMPTVQVLT